MNNIQNELINTIELLIAKNGNNPISIDSPAVVTRVNGNGTYEVIVNGQTYTAIDGIGIKKISVGSGVYVRAMNGNFKELYIMCKRSPV